MRLSVNFSPNKVSQKFPILTRECRRFFCYVQWRRNELESGGTGPAQSAGKQFFGRAPPLFGSKSTVSRFDERLRDGQ